MVQMISKTLPMTEGLKILRLLMVENKPFTYVLENGDLLLLIVNSALYLSIGLISFKCLEKVARERGLLGVY